MPKPLESSLYYLLLEPPKGFTRQFWATLYERTNHLRTLFNLMAGFGVLLFLGMTDRLLVDSVAA